MDFQVEQKTEEKGRIAADQRENMEDYFEGVECSAHLSDASILELMKSNGLESASTQSLFSMVKRILNETTERKTGGTSQLVYRLLRAIVQEIEKRFSSQAENVKNQNRFFKAREDRYRIRIRTLETLATGTTEENMVLMNRFQQIKTEKTGFEVIKNHVEEDIDRLNKEKLQSNFDVQMLKKELETIKSAHEEQFLQVEAESREAKTELEKKLKLAEHLLEDSRIKVMELEAYLKSMSERWRRKEYTYHSFINIQSKALQDLRGASDSIKDEFLRKAQSYIKSFNQLGLKLRGLADAAENYHVVLAENRKLYSEVQDLKGNIRVYCRIRPFLSGQNIKQSTIEYIGENGDIVVSDPLKHGKDSHRLFKFNKLFGPDATQEEVFLDTQPLIRSVLDGYNVCIFAYGQTGSGKTYTMSGPGMSSKEDWGVNYRALHDLFHISQIRKNSISYEVGVQMVEIYNEQVRDLLASDGTQNRLAIWNITQPNGLAVPDASMHSVKSTGDVLELMNIGLMNRAIGATAINERSSRSHSVLTVHVRGTDIKTNEIFRGNLHLVDLAGSERADRSEATGDRLREAQYINKSLSALGDVIFALAHKTSHVPYRNSKLTQLLQSSLGGHAKTLMFVQINPDVGSYSETVSTLKFAERVSGVELGAARSSKDGRDLKELMEQVAILKDTVVKKDGEIERLLHLQVNSSGGNNDSQRHRSASYRRHSLETLQLGRRQAVVECLGRTEKAASYGENGLQHSNNYVEADFQQSMHICERPIEFFKQSKPASGNASQNSNEDIELLGFAEGDTEERLSDISDGELLMGTESDSMGSAVENTLFSSAPKVMESANKRNAPPKIQKPLQNSVPTRSSELSGARSSSKISSSRKTLGGSSSSRWPIRRALYNEWHAKK